MVNWIAVNPDCKGWQNLQSLSALLQLVTKHFTVGDETYIGTYRTVPLSFVTDCKNYATNCKSDDSACKFCQPLQSVTIARTTIRLTITRGGRLKSDPVRPGGGGLIENSNFWFHTPRGGGHTGWGAIEIISPAKECGYRNFLNFLRHRAFGGSAWHISNGILP